MTVTRHWTAEHIRDIADYPTGGVTFRDITPLLGHAEAFRRAVDELADRFEGIEVSRVLGIEARGFILAAPIAYRMGAGFVPVRKEYDLEYGTDKLEIHRDAIRPGERVLVIDDVLATGGTAAATCRLVEELGGEIVGLGFMLEIEGLDGRRRLGDRLIESLGS